MRILDVFNNLGKKGKLIVIAGGGIATVALTYSLYKLYNISTQSTEMSSLEESDEEPGIPERKVLVLGLEGAGKTSFSSALSKPDVTTRDQPKPTQGFHVVCLTIDGLKLNIWEIGGSKLDYWPNFVSDTNILVYVVDASNPSSFEQAKKVLNSVLNEPKLHGIPVLLVTTKNDEPGAKSLEEVMSSLELNVKLPSESQVKAVAVDVKSDGVTKGLVEADGSGNYSAEASTHSKIIEKAIPLVQEAIQSIHVQPGSVFTVADYGAADGGTSMPLIYQVVKAVRERYGEEMPITVIYEDQPVNDFKSLFKRLQGFIPGPRSYLKDFQNVLAMACGTNFYSQCFPSKTVHLGFAATCAHYLRKKPCDIKNGLFDRECKDESEMEMFSDQAEEDWKLFLLNRAEELTQGGYLVLTQPAIDNNGHHTGRTIFCAMTKLWKKLFQEEIITEGEFLTTTFPSYSRTKEEFEKPFEDPQSLVRRKGLELVSFKIEHIPCVYRERWLREYGDPKQHAKRLVDSLRMWSYSTLFSGLSNNRSEEEKAQIVQELYDRFESLVAKSPEDYGMNMVNAYMVLRKT